MPTLFIRVLSPATESADGYSIHGEWLIVEGDGEKRAGGITDYRGFGELLDPTTAWLGNPGNVVLIVPSEFVLGISCEVPGRNMAQIRKALPFVVEEFVATDIEGMHLAHGTIARGEPVRCNLVERSLLLNWQECFAGLGAAPGHIISEAELLPDEPDTAYALFDGDSVLFKTGDQAATIDRVNLAFAAGSLTEGRLRIVNGVLSDAERAEILDSTSLEIETDPESSVEDSTLGYLSERWRAHQHSVINLLQGEHKPPSADSGRNARWRGIAALAACWCLVAVVMLVAQGIWANSRAARLETDALAIYRDIYPDDKRVNANNLRRRLQQSLGEGSVTGAPGLLNYVAEIANLVDASIELNGMNFSSQRGELSLDIVAVDFNKLDGIKEQLEGQGYAVEIVSAQQQQDNKVRARLRLGGTS